MSIYNNILLFLKKKKLNNSLHNFEKFDKLKEDIYNKKYIIELYKIIIQIYDINNTIADKLISRIIYILAQQSIYNPPYYNSHGTDHSIRVLQYALKIFNKNELLQSYIYNKYNLDKKKIKLSIKLLTLLHDVGYSDIEKVTCLLKDDACNKIPKFVHSYSSAIMISDTKYINLFNKLLNDEIYTDIIKAVEHHNHDSIGCKNSHSDKCLFISNNQHTKYISQDKKIVREYIEVNIEDNPLLFLLRLSDNLDFTRERLTHIQKNKKILLFLRTLYNLDTNTFESQNINMKNDFIKSNNIKNNSSEYILIMNAIHNDFLFYYSCWIVKKFKFIYNNKNNILTLFINFYEDTYNKKFILLNKSKNKYASEYQLIRMKDSFNTLLINNISIINKFIIKIIYNNKIETINLSNLS